MEKLEKNKIVYAIALVIVGLVITSSASVVSQELDTKENKLITKEVTVREVYQNNMPIPRSIERSELNIPLVAKNIPHPKNIPVVSTEENEAHPAITAYGSGLLWGGFTTQYNLFEQTIDFLYSADNGETWDIPSGLNPDIGIIDHVSMDSLGTGIIVTFQPDPGLSEQWRIIMPDPLDTGTWDGSVWDWSSFDYYDFKNLDVAGYYIEDKPWYYGMMVGSVSDLAEGTNDMATLFFANGVTKNSGWIWPWGDQGEISINPAIDVDTSNSKFYAVYENYNETSGARDILVGTAYLNDFLPEDPGDWGPYPSWELLGGAESNRNPDVATSDENVYIVCEADDAIICFYSNDNGDNWNQATIASNGMYPTITANGEEAMVAFTSNGNIYTSVTENGGASWSSYY